jgi:dihydrofolate reductase
MQKNTVPYMENNQAKVVIWAIVGTDNVIKEYPDTDHAYRFIRELFKKESIGHNVIMNSSLYDSLAPTSRPMPCRTVFIISDNDQYVLDKKKTRTHLCETFDETLKKVAAKNIQLIKKSKTVQHAFIIGDAALFTDIFRREIEHIDEIILISVKTIITGEHFPFLPPDDWEKSTPIEYAQNAECPHDFKYVLYKNAKQKPLISK